jgi:hypothetical protein
MMDDPVNWCKKNWIICLLVVGVALCATGNLQPLMHNVMSALGLEGFSLLGNSNSNKNANNSNKNANRKAFPMPAEEKSQAGQLAVSGTRVPASCYPQTPLKPEELLPESESKAIQQFKSAAPKADGILAVNMLDAGYNIGIDSVGQSLRNANRQLRSEPPNPQVNVSPWMNTSIGPDLIRRPLELNESCQ